MRPRLVIPLLVMGAFVAGSAALAMGANAVITPSSGNPGEKMSVRGIDFHSDEQVIINWDHPAVKVASATADGSGGFEVSFGIPGDAPTGSHRLVIAGSLGSVVISTVQIGDSPLPSPSPDSANGSTWWLFPVVTGLVGLAVGVLVGRVVWTGSR